jgi:hypothetical protein
MNLLTARHRASKRSKLIEFVRARLRQPIPSIELHMRFGTAVRARISEINRDPAGELVIENHTYLNLNDEISSYTASVRSSPSLVFELPPRPWCDPEER